MASQEEAVICEQFKRNQQTAFLEGLYLCRREFEAYEAGMGKVAPKKIVMGVAGGGCGAFRVTSRVVFLRVDMDCIWGDNGTLLPSAFVAVLLKRQVLRMGPGRTKKLVRVPNNDKAPDVVADIFYEQLLEMDYDGRSCVNAKAGKECTRQVCTPHNHVLRGTCGEYKHLTHTASTNT